jgi:Ser/Thr protein kinase RdoA (MazF antagonist)
MDFVYYVDMQIIRSIISSEKVLEKALEDYCLEKNHFNCKLIKAVGSNDIYLLESANNKLILKIYSNRKCWPYIRETFLQETSIMNFLYEKKISLPKPIPNILGSYVSTIPAAEYDKFYVVYEYIEGTVYDKTRPDYPRLFCLGKSLANLHNASEKFDLNTCSRYINIDFLINNSQKRINEFANLSKELLNALNHLATDLRDQYNNLNYKDLVQCIIHGDMHSGNHKYINEQVIFIDFELCGIGFRMYDLAVFKWNLFFSYKGQKLIKAWQSFWDGYRSVNILNQAELDALNLLMRIRQFFFLGSTFIIYPESASYNNNSTMLQMYKMINKYY